MNEQQEHRWHACISRLNDANYVALTPVAKAALACIEELIERAEGEPIQGPKRVIAGWIGFNLKWLNESLAQLAPRFITVSDSENGISITLVGTKQGRSKAQASPKQGPTKTRPRTKQGPTMDEARPVHGPKELANDADCSGRTLIENEKEKEKESITPLTPQGDVQVDLFEAEFWPDFPKVPGRSNKAEAKRVFNNLPKAKQRAAIDGLRKHKAIYAQQHDMSTDGWRFFKSAQSWLRKETWLTLDVEQAQPTIADMFAGMIDPEELAALDRAAEAARARHVKHA